VPDALALLELYTAPTVRGYRESRIGVDRPGRDRQIPAPQVHMDRAVGQEPVCYRGPYGLDQGAMSGSDGEPVIGGRVAVGGV
jgi:hypothetical protein